MGRASKFTDEQKLEIALELLAAKMSAAEDIMDLEPPSWAGAPGTLYGTYDFAEAQWEDEGTWRVDAAENQLMVPHATNPDPEEFDDPEGGYMYQYWTGVETVWYEEYEGREGVLNLGEEGEDAAFSFDIQNFPGPGTKRIRIQLVTFGDAFTFMELEGYDGGTGTYFEEVDPVDALISEVDLGEGWFHVVYEYEIPGNPEMEYITIIREGEGTTAIDQAVIDTICYDGESPPAGPGRAGAVMKTAISYDPNITTIYEPQDPEEFGPEPPGPVVGNFGVKLGWRPGEDPCNPGTYLTDVTVTVTLDPNTEGDKDHDDYFIWGGDPDGDGTITLVFDANNYDELQKVHIEAIKDLDREGNESYNLGLTSVCAEDPCFQDAEQTLRVNVIDNDVRHVSALPSRITLSESHVPPDPCGTESIEVRLSHQPSNDATVYVLVWGEEWAFEEEMFVIDPNFEDWKSLYGEPNKMTFTATTATGNPIDDPPVCADWDPDNMTSCWNKPLTIYVHARDNDWVTEPWTTNHYGFGRLYTLQRRPGVLRGLVRGRPIRLPARSR